MKLFNNTIILACFMLLLISLTACSKKDNTQDLDLKQSQVSMEIDGKPWKSKMALLTTVAPEYNEEDYYAVAIAAVEVEMNGTEVDDEANGLFLWILIPKTKFSNPIGTYKVYGEDEQRENVAFAMFNTGAGGQETIYFSADPAGKSVGTITIDKFKVGKQSSYGGYGGTEGYTQLSGTFEMNLIGFYGNENTEEKVIKLTNGKFNVKEGLNLGSLIGKKSSNKVINSMMQSEVN